MAKVKKAFFCNNCGAESAKWIGKCPACNEWNTYVEEIIHKETKQEEKSKAWKSSENKIGHRPKKLQEIATGNTIRIDTRDNELNRVLGGGIVNGSLILIGGQPGIGKSTLMLQLAMQLPISILYVSGEESEEQIKMRAERLGGSSDCYIYTETNINTILGEAQKLKPQLLIVDSIQTLSSPYLDATPGSISQVRECTGELQRFAKETNIPIFLIGHITKDGSLAGPKLLEHIVDVVLQFEGDQNYSYRILRTLKNRFGSTDELGIYAMDSGGLRQVNNPSELLISQNEEILSGSTIAASIEGQRPLLMETQALVSPAIYGNPQRSTTGFDLRRMNMLLAVLEKRCGLPFGQNDVFLNMAGGLRVSDPAIDLAIISALISSLEEITVDKKICFAGEVGLSGEIRAVSRAEQRVQEADRLGFDQIVVSKYSTKGLSSKKLNINIQPVGKIEDLLKLIFS